jgi:hypothetical protein
MSAEDVVALGETPDLGGTMTAHGAVLSLWGIIFGAVSS